MGDSIPSSSSICTDLKNHEQTTDSFTATSSAISINSRILIVDDEQDIATLYKLSLQYNGFAVDAFNDPLLAFSNYKPDVYDLLLLDIRMPGMNGFELYKNIKNIDHKAKVCFITAFEEYEHDFKDLYPKLDVDCFIRKPIEMHNLVKIIKSSMIATKRPLFCCLRLKLSLVSIPWNSYAVVIIV